MFKAIPDKSVDFTGEVHILALSRFIATFFVFMPQSKQPNFTIFFLGLISLNKWPITSPKGIVPVSFYICVSQTWPSGSTQRYNAHPEPFLGKYFP